MMHTKNVLKNMPLKMITDLHDKFIEVEDFCRASALQSEHKKFFVRMVKPMLRSRILDHTDEQQNRYLMKNMLSKLNLLVVL